MSRDEAERAYFELRFAPSLDLVASVRKLVNDVVARVLQDPSLAANVALAAHELLENAVKYSVDGETYFSIAVGRVDGQPMVEMRTRNRALGLNATQVERRVAEMGAYRNPFAFYQALIQRSARTNVRGGLGLGRILGEADMRISCEIQDDYISVIARSRQAEEAA